MKLASLEFEQLAVEQLDTVYRVARRLARDPNLAEDLVQETYLRALSSRDTFDMRDLGLRPWLLRILHNLHITRSQREYRQPLAMETDQLEMAAGVSQPPRQFDLGSWDGMDDQLKGAIEALPEDYRSLLLLWAVEELPYKEIAQVLDIPIGTVMSRLHRIRSTLSQQLHDHAVDRRIIRE